MLLLLVSLALFGLVHILPALTVVKSAGASILGRSYGAVYGSASTVLLGIAIWAVRGVDRTRLYDVPDWGHHANYVFSLIGFLLLGIFLFRGSWRNRLRYPMALGVLFWAFGHLLANGDLQTTVFFLCFALFALVHAVLKARQGPFQPSDERAGHNTLSLFAGLALYGLMTQLHYAIIGKALVTLN